MTGFCHHIGIITAHPQTLITFYSEKIGQKRPLDAAGYNHWGLTAKDKEAYIDELKAEGVKVPELKREGRTIFFGADPDGNLVEIYGARMGQR
jgi:catechol-2,3-dioxygenase